MKTYIKKTVVFVDDDERITKAYIRMMKQHCPTFDTKTFNKVKDALELISLADLVVTDWQMPDGGGRVIIDKCLQMNIPVIVCSGSLPENFDQNVYWLGKDSMSGLPSLIKQELD